MRFSRLLHISKLHILAPVAMALTVSLFTAVPAALAQAPKDSGSYGPVVTIVSPEYSDVIKDVTPIAIAIAPRRYPAQSVELLVDGKAVSGILPVQTKFKWDTKLFIDGPHTLGVRVTDTQGFIGQAETTIYINNNQRRDSSAPILRWVGIQSGQKLSGVAKIRLEAGDNFGVKYVFLNLNSAITPDIKPPLASWMTNRPPYEFSLDTSRFEDGLYVLDAYAWDDMENERNAPRLTIGFFNSSTKPSQETQQIIEPDATTTSTQNNDSTPTTNARIGNTQAGNGSTVNNVNPVAPPTFVYNPPTPTITTNTSNGWISRSSGPSQSEVQQPSHSQRITTLSSAKVTEPQIPLRGLPESIPSPNLKIAPSPVTRTAPVTTTTLKSTAPTTVNPVSAPPVFSPPTAVSNPNAVAVPSAPAGNPNATITYSNTAFASTPNPRTLASANLASANMGLGRSTAETPKVTAPPLTTTTIETTTIATTSSYAAVQRMTQKPVLDPSLVSAQNCTTSISRSTRASLSPPADTSTRYVLATPPGEVHAVAAPAASRTNSSPAPAMPVKPEMNWTTSAQFNKPPVATSSNHGKRTVVAPAPVKGNATAMISPTQPPASRTAMPSAASGNSEPLTGPARTGFAVTTPRSTTRVNNSGGGQPAATSVSNAPEVAPVKVPTTQAASKSTPQSPSAAPQKIAALPPNSRPRVPVTDSDLTPVYNQTHSTRIVFAAPAAPVRVASSQSLPTVPRLAFSPNLSKPATSARAGAAIVVAPSLDAPIVHVAIHDDTLAAIAARYKMPLTAVAAANNMKGNARIAKGAKVLLPQALLISYKGQAVTGDVAPLLIGSTSVAPFRFLFEKQGGTMKWDSINQRIVARNSAYEVTVQVGSDVAIVNEKEVLMDMAAFLLSGRTMVPVRFFEKALQAKVEWEPSTGRIFVAMTP